MNTSWINLQDILITLNSRPIISMISIRLATSEISGTQSKVTISSDKIIAGISATTLFFLAPLMGDLTFANGRPPLLTIFSCFLFQDLLKGTFHFYYTIIFQFFPIPIY